MRTATVASSAGNKTATSKGARKETYLCSPQDQCCQQVVPCRGAFHMYPQKDKSCQGRTDMDVQESFIEGVPQR